MLGQFVLLIVPKRYNVGISKCGDTRYVVILYYTRALHCTIWNLSFLLLLFTCVVQNLLDNKVRVLVLKPNQLDDIMYLDPRLAVNTQLGVVNMITSRVHVFSYTFLALDKYYFYLFLM